jgi:hypothetical protein
MAALDPVTHGRRLADPPVKPGDDGSGLLLLEMKRR